MSETTIQETPVAPLSEEERQELLAREIEKSEKLATSQIEMAHLFLQQNKVDIARRRLQKVLDEYPQAEAAREARKLLKKLDAEHAA